MSTPKGFSSVGKLQIRLKTRHGRKNASLVSFIKSSSLVVDSIDSVIIIIIIYYCY